MKWFKRNRAQDDTQRVPVSDKSANADFVSVLDTTTQTVTRLPARELSTHMVEAQVDGIEGTVWVDVRELRPGQYQHPPFTEEVRDILREIKEAVDEFYCLSMEQWEDGFRRDAHPEREIAAWYYLATLYRNLTSSRELSLQQRRDYFKLLVTCLNSPREHVLHVFSPDAISVAEANDVMDQFYKSEA